MKFRIFSFLICLCLISGCSRRPIVYDNAKAKRAGDKQVQIDIDKCLEKAKKAGATQTAGQKAGDAAIDATGGAAAGAAGGAVAGAIWNGKVGRGVGAGAAAGGTGTFVSRMVQRGPDNITRRYVETCLRERGYQPIGWR